MPEQVTPVTFRKASRIPVGRDQLLNTLEFVIEPLVLAISLWAVTLVYLGYLAPRYIILSLLVFSYLSGVDLFDPGTMERHPENCRRMASNCGASVCFWLR